MALNDLGKGKILIAKESLRDNLFCRSIVYLTEHSGSGTVGFIINKKSDKPLNEFMHGFKQSLDVYCGGPVEPDMLYFIHDVPQQIPGSVAIGDNVYWGGDFAVLRKKLNNGSVKPYNVRFFLGYMGWDQGQLRDEIADGFWMLHDCRLNPIHSQSLELWERLSKYPNIDYLLWANAPKDPMLN